MKARNEDYPFSLIDPPSPFAPTAELEAFRKDCLQHLQAYRGNLQWEAELASVERHLREHPDGPEKFLRAAYRDLNSRQKENYNFHKVAGRLDDYGFNCIRLTDDCQGADFIAVYIDGETFLKVQLKARLIIDRRYEGKEIHIAFLHGDDLFLYDHDAFLKHLIDNKRIGDSSTSWHDKGFRTWPSPPSWALSFLKAYRILA